MPARFPFVSRRMAWLSVAGSLWLAACGGGGSEAEPPADSPRLAADRTAVHVGDQVLLTASFRAGQARIEPGLGTVVSGVPLRSPVLDRDTVFELVVEAPGRPVQRHSLAVAVSYRDRYAATGSSFAASQHSAVAAADGSVLLIGGSRGEGTLSDAVDRFDPATGRVQRIGTLAAGRAAHRATRLDDGQILLTGGLFSDTQWRRAELVDERSGQSSPAGTMSVARVDHAALLLSDGRVLVSGGYASGERAPLGISDSAELWDPATRQFRRLAQRMSIGRAAHTMTLLADGRVLIVGGYSAAADYRFAEIFDPRDERFTPVADAQALRANHVAQRQADGRVLILGGETVPAGGDAILPLASVLRYDPASGRFETVKPLAVPRTWAAGVPLPSGALLLFGGQQAMPRYSASAERYDPASGGQPIATLDGERALHSATRLADGRVLLAGGEAWGGAFRSSLLVYE